MQHAELKFRKILEQALKLLKVEYPSVIDFMRGNLFEDIAFEEPAIRSLPVASLLGECVVRTTTETLPLVTAIIGAGPYIEWQHSYTEEDGFDADYLSHSGWFNLVSPEGPLFDPDIRISVGYWGQGLHYQEHWHEPEEIYIPLSGQALFHSEGRSSRQCGPGEMVVHERNQKHSIDMDPDPLLAMAVWRGKNLLKKSGLLEKGS